MLVLFEITQVKVVMINVTTFKSKGQFRNYKKDLFSVTRSSTFGDFCHCPITMEGEWRFVCVAQRINE